MMNFLPRFTDPQMLSLLLLIPFFIYLGLKVHTLSTFRKTLAITLRILILLALIAALAGVELVKHNDKLAVFFLLDHSNSVPEDVRLAAAQHVRNTCDIYMTEGDEVGVIVFGDDASIELQVDETLGLRDVRSYVRGDQTDLSGALRLAMAAFPQGYMRRIVLFSDGNETKGSALEEVKAAQAEGIQVDIVPLNTGGRQEVRVKEVSTPSQAKSDEPFQLRIVVESDQTTEGALQVYQRVAGERRMLAPRSVQLAKGDNVFLVSQELGTPGFYEYEAVITADTDTITENNQGRSFTYVQGEPRVLYVESHPEESVYLQPALEKEGILVDRVHPHSMPTSLAQLQNYDAVVLSDVSSTDLQVEQLAMLEGMVRDHGIGLVMIGGPDTFGAGGYLNSPVEKALPLDMDIKQRKIMPRGALVLVMHTCEIPQGNMWAREIGLASLDVLSSQDLMGAVGYMYDRRGGDAWIYTLQPVNDKTMMRQTLTTASTQIGDMPAVGPSLTMAYRALVNADAAVKRAILISDGDPAAPAPSLLRQLKDANIAVSTICIAPHSGSDESMLRNIANVTGGQYYFVNNPKNLPQIFTKEASVVRRGILWEKPFQPAILHDSEILSGAAMLALPQLNGYVVTTPKENATVPLVSEEGDPVMAHWRYGIGKSVAFTSDVTTRWATDWINWEGFAPFWAQTLRWAMREITPSNFQIETGLKDGRGFLKIDAMDESGNYINFLKPRAIVTTPEFESLDLVLTQTAPGLYEATFPADDSGVYLANIIYSREDGSTGMAPAGLAVDYSLEYIFNTPNRPLLEQLAHAGNGRVLGATPENVFEHNLKASASITPIWPWLLVLAACLFPFEIFIRRVVLPWGLIAAFMLGALRTLPGLKRFIPVPKTQALPMTGRYEAATHDFGTAQEAVTFGVVQETAPQSKMTTPTTEQTSTRESITEDQKPTGSSAYTQQLLAAKERARQQQLRGKDKK